MRVAVSIRGAKITTNVSKFGECPDKPLSTSKAGVSVVHQARFMALEGAITVQMVHAT